MGLYQCRNRIISKWANWICVKLARYITNGKRYAGVINQLEV